MVRLINGWLKQPCAWWKTIFLVYHRFDKCLELKACG